jgi:hypothetical protein
MEVCDGEKVGETAFTVVFGRVTGGEAVLKQQSVGS